MSSPSDPNSHRLPDGTFPDPAHNPACQCYPNMMRAHLCMTGHMLECHYPWTCEQARCGHWKSEVENWNGEGAEP